MMLSDCCNAPLVNDDTEMCSKCKEWCDTYDDEEEEKEIKMKIEIELPEIPGYEYTNKRREPTKYEWYLDDNNIVKQADYDYENRHFPILKKLDDPKLPEKWDDFGTDDKYIKHLNNVRDYLKHLKDEINILKENK